MAWTVKLFTNNILFSFKDLSKEEVETPASLKREERLRKFRELHFKRVSESNSFLLLVKKQKTNTEASNCITSKCFLCQNEARKLNHQEVVEEDKKLKLPSNWEAKKARLEWELADSEKRKVRVFFVFFSTCKVSHSPWNQPERRRVTMCRSVRQTAKTTTEWKCWRSQLMMPSVGRGRRRRRTQILDLQVWLSGTMLEA